MYCKKRCREKHNSITVCIINHCFASYDCLEILAAVIYQPLLACMKLFMVFLFTVAPSIQTVFLLQLCDIHVYAWNESLSRQISDHVQPVPVTTVIHLFTIHHLSRTMKHTSFATSLCA